MKNLFFTTAFFASVLAAVAAGAETLSITIPDAWLKAQTKETTFPLQVTGTATVKAAPDRVVISATIYTQDKKLGAAFDANQYKTRAVMDALEALAIPRDKVTTESLTISPVYREASSKVDFYYVSRTIKIIQDDLNKISPVLDALVDAGVGDIGTVQFVVKDLDKKYREAIEEAAADARETADRLAAAMGARVVGLQALSYDFGGYGPTRELERRGYAMEEAGRAEMNQMIVPGEYSGNVNVHATFKVQYGAP